MSDDIKQDAAARLIRRSDFVAEGAAFIDCKIPGSTLKENYSIIGAGVTQSENQVVNLAEQHGFAIGAAAMPNGVTNNLHVHYTAEVFLIFRGEWLFRWGQNGESGEFIGREGDVVSIPTWIFRGFTNVGPDDGWIFTGLGRDDSGGVIWDPEILRGAGEYGLYLKRNNMMVDTSTGAEKPAEDELMEPLSDEVIGSFRKYTMEEMRGRVTPANERRWSSRSLLDSAIPGHGGEIAPVIGWGMTQDRDAMPKVINPHGFTVEWLRIPAGGQVGPFRIAPKQVLIVKHGEMSITLGRGAEATSVGAGEWDVFSTPESAWRTLRASEKGEVLVAVVTSGDNRAMVEWDEAIVHAARAHGVGIDPNGYVAIARWLPVESAA